MKNPSEMSHTAKLVEGALMVALAFVLAAIPFFQMPWGGSVTFISTLPIIVMSLRHGGKWGVATAAVYGFTQMLYGFQNVLAAKYIWAMVLCALLDYLIAYTVIGFVGPIARRFKNATVGITVGIVATGLVRLLCSFLSGVLIWGGWAPEGMSVWYYSLAYNAGWCLPDVALVLVAALLLSRVKALSLTPEASVQ